MPPRLQLVSRLGAFNLSVRPATPKPTGLPVMQTASISMRERKKWAKKNPYLYQIQQQRKAANVKRQAELEASREYLMGDPVHGITTPWIESLDSGGQNEFSIPPTDEDGNPLEEPHPLPTSKHIMNYGITTNEFEKALGFAEELTKPVKSADRLNVDIDLEKRQQEAHKRDHEKRAEAVRRIAELQAGNSKNRLKANVHRVVETFGRHETDKIFPEKPKSLIAPPREPTPRAGPDTGSSEVQVGILTAKIRALAQELEKTGGSDKHNKRNLRILVHKRQKLLKYMWRKEKGSARWNHMVETLGITNSCWKGEISL